MTDWPETLPDYVLVEGYQETAPDGSIRSKNDTGVDKVRPRFTAAARNITAGLSLTAAQTEILDDFYKTTLKFGALPFDWVHPRTQAACSFRIKGTPTYEPRGVGYTAKLNLEILP